MNNPEAVLPCSQQYRAIQNFWLCRISSCFSSPSPSHISQLLLGGLPVSGIRTYSAWLLQSCYAWNVMDLTSYWHLAPSASRKYCCIWEVLQLLFILPLLKCFLSVSLSPLSNLIVAAMQQFFSFRGKTKIQACIWRAKRTGTVSKRQARHLNSQMLPGQRAARLFRGAAVFGDLRDKPDKMLGRNKRYSNSVEVLEPRIRTQTGEKGFLNVIILQSQI